MLVKRTDPNRSNEVIFIKDEPRIFKPDGSIFTIYYDTAIKDGIRNFTPAMKGRYHMPNGMFNMPQRGDFIDYPMGNEILRSVVTSFTQDHVSGEGEVAILCFLSKYNAWIALNKYEPTEAVKETQPTTAP